MSDYKVKAWSWCADYCKKNHWNPHDSYFWNKAMLQYRRANNIFEVGDWVVSTLEGNEFWMKLVCEIEAFHKKMAITKSDGHIIHHYDFRHATPEEIKAGKRL